MFYRYLLLSFFISINAVAQDNDALSIIHNNKPGKIFIIDHSKPFTYKDDEGRMHKGKNYDSSIWKYLGNVKMKNGRTVKLLTKSSYYGPQPHGNGWILVYDISNRYIGKYLMGSVSEIPDELKDGEMVFETLFGSMKCRTGLIKTVFLKNGLPQTFYLGCKDGYGSSYGFVSY